MLKVALLPPALPGDGASGGGDAATAGAAAAPAAAAADLSVDDAAAALYPPGAAVVGFVMLGDVRGSAAATMTLSDVRRAILDEVDAAPPTFSFCDVHGNRLSSSIEAELLAQNFMPVVTIQPPATGLVRVVLDDPQAAGVISARSGGDDMTAAGATGTTVASSTSRRSGSSAARPRQTFELGADKTFADLGQLATSHWGLRHEHYALFDLDGCMWPSVLSVLTTLRGHRTVKRRRSMSPSARLRGERVARAEAVADADAEGAAGSGAAAPSTPTGDAGGGGEPGDGAGAGAAASSPRRSRSVRRGRGSKQTPSPARSVSRRRHSSRSVSLSRADGEGARVVNMTVILARVTRLPVGESETATPSRRGSSATGSAASPRTPDAANVTGELAGTPGARGVVAALRKTPQPGTSVYDSTPDRLRELFNVDLQATTAARRELDAGVDVDGLGATLDGSRNVVGSDAIGVHGTTASTLGSTGAGGGAGDDAGSLPGGGMVSRVAVRLRDRVGSRPRQCLWCLFCYYSMQGDTRLLCSLRMLQFRRMLEDAGVISEAGGLTAADAGILYSSHTQGSAKMEFRGFLSALADVGKRAALRRHRRRVAAINARRRKQARRTGASEKSGPLPPAPEADEAFAVLARDYLLPLALDVMDEMDESVAVSDSDDSRLRAPKVRGLLSDFFEPLYKLYSFYAPRHDLYGKWSTYGAPGEGQWASSAAWEDETDGDRERDWRARAAHFGAQAAAVPSNASVIPPTKLRGASAAAAAAAAARRRGGRESVVSIGGGDIDERVIATMSLPGVYEPRMSYEAFCKFFTDLGLSQKYSMSPRKVGVLFLASTLSPGILLARRSSNWDKTATGSVAGSVLGGTANLGGTWGASSTRGTSPAPDAVRSTPGGSPPEVVAGHARRGTPAGGSTSGPRDLGASGGGASEDKAAEPDSRGRGGPAARRASMAHRRRRTVTGATAAAAASAAAASTNGDAADDDDADSEREMRTRLSFPQFVSALVRFTFHVYPQVCSLDAVTMVKALLQHISRTLSDKRVNEILNILHHDTSASGAEHSLMLRGTPAASAHVADEKLMREAAEDLNAVFTRMWRQDQCVEYVTGMRFMPPASGFFGYADKPAAGASAASGAAGGTGGGAPSATRDAGRPPTTPKADPAMATVQSDAATLGRSLVYRRLNLDDPYSPAIEEVAAEVTSSTDEDVDDASDDEGGGSGIEDGGEGAARHMRADSRGAGEARSFAGASVSTTRASLKRRLSAVAASARFVRAAAAFSGSSTTAAAAKAAARRRSTLAFPGAAQLLALQQMVLEEADEDDGSDAQSGGGSGSAAASARGSGAAGGAAGAATAAGGDAGGAATAARAGDV